MSFVDEVAEELVSVRKRQKPFNSFHEGWGVMAEEMDEFWEEVRKRPSKRDLKNMRRELVQIAGIAQRIAEDLL